MSALHAAPALGALPDGHIKAPDGRPDDGEIFLVLRRHVLQCHRPAAPRTRRRERGLVGRINPGGNRATRPASIPTAGPPPRPPAPALGPIFGERCGLTEPGAPRGTEQLGEALVLSRQPIPLTLPPIPLALESISLVLEPISHVPRLCQLVPQTRECFIGASDQLVTSIVRGMCAFISHLRFMADSRQKYKYNIVITPSSLAKRRRLAYLGHVLLDNRHGLVANVCATHATGTAERDAATLLLEASAPPGSTVGADKGYDVASFVADVRVLAVTPHVAQKARWSAVDGRTTRHTGLPA